MQQHLVSGWLLQTGTVSYWITRALIEEALCRIYAKCLCTAKRWKWCTPKKKKKKGTMGSKLKRHNFTEAEICWWVSCIVKTPPVLVVTVVSAHYSLSGPKNLNFLPGVPLTKVSWPCQSITQNYAPVPLYLLVQSDCLTPCHILFVTMWLPCTQMLRCSWAS